MIRRVEERDEQEVYKMLCALEHEQFDQTIFHEVFKFVNEDDSIAYFLLEEDERIKGMISIRVLTHLHHCAKVAMIEECFVKLDERRCGVGTSLFQYAIEYALHLDCIEIELSSRMTRLPAHCFYEALNMKKEHYKFTLNLIGFENS